MTDLPPAKTAIAIATAEPKPISTTAADETFGIGTETASETRIETIAADPERRPECFNSTFQECLFVLTATMAIGQISFFQGAIMGISAAIGRDLGMNAAEITWINAGCSYVFFLSDYLCLVSIFKHYANHADWFTKQG